MSVASQVLAYLKVLAWPVIALVALTIFRVPIRRMIDGLQEFEGFGIKARIGRQVADGIAAAAVALDDSPPGPAASSDGDRSHSQPGLPRYSPPRPMTVVFQAQEALAVSSRFARPDPETGDDTAEAMRSYLHWLDTAIIAVVTVFLTSDAAEHGVAVSQSDSEDVANLTAQRIERDLTDATGISGWRGVIEARNILSGTVVLICGQGAAAVSQASARRFVRVVLRALSQWQDLVKQAGDVRGPTVSAR